MGFHDIANAFAAVPGALGVAIACAPLDHHRVVTLTGLGLKMANGLVEIAGGNLLFTLSSP